MNYRPEIDGLRAIAVVPVILFHAGVPAFEGGYIGVDVFFVISGYLITSIILDDLSTGTFSLRKFYFRRARRILPALFVVMFMCIPAAWFLMAPHQAKDFAQSLVATTAFLSNLFFYLETDYFHPFAETSPLLHTWSLAIEEQFYLVFPLLALLLARHGRRVVVLTFVALFLASFGLMEWVRHIDPIANFYLPVTRAWELLSGALCAVYLNRSARPAWRGSPALVGLALILLSVLMYDKKTPFPSAFTIVPVAGTVLIILFGDGRSWAGRFLRVSPVVFVGMASYSLYLWHQPVLAYARVYSISPLTPPMIAVTLAFAGALGFLSWRFVEQPIRRYPRPTWRFFGAILVSASILASVGIWGHKSVGWEDFMLRRIPAELRQYVVDFEAEAEKRQEVWTRLQAGHHEPFGGDDSKRRVLILGDFLVGTDMFVALRIEQPKRFSGLDVRMITLDDSCMSAALSFVQEKEVEDDRCLKEIEVLKESMLLDSADVVTLAAAWQRNYVSDVVDLAKWLNSNSKTVLIVGATNFNQMTSMSLDIAKGGALPADAGRYFFTNLRMDWRRHSLAIREGVAGIDAIDFLDRSQVFCDFEKEECNLYNEEGVPLIYDTEHLTEAGARFLARRMAELGWFEETGS